MRQRRTRYEKHRVDIDVHGRRPLFVGGLFGLGVINHAGAVDHGIESAEQPDRLGDRQVALPGSGEIGGLDAVVNSAGVIYHAEAEQTTDEQWATTMNVNVNAVFFVSRAALPELRATRGTLVNIASDAALTGSSRLVAYCASKGAVLQMTRAMARDHAGEGIRIVPICPGDVDTPMLRGEFRDRGLDADTGLRESAAAVPLNRVCTPGEVADLVLYACSDSAAFITGYPLVLDGGNRA